MRPLIARSLACALVLSVLVVATVPAAAAIPPIQPKPATGWIVESPSAIIIDVASGRVLFEKNADERRAPASLTKIMTLTLTFEAIRDGKLSLDTPISASPEACTYGGTQIWLKPGETFRAEDLIKAIAVGSANDAAVAVAEHIGGSIQGFADMMNAKAAELGMSGTHYMNPHGLDEENHYTTARDMATLARYAVTVPDLIKYTSIWQDYIRDGKSWLVNTNRMVRHYSGCDGLKTGKTSQSGFCVVATATRDNARYVSAIMGAATSEARFNDAARLLNTAFATFRAVPVARKDDVVKTIPVRRGRAEQIEAVLPQDFVITVERGEEKGLEQTVTVADQLLAPVRAGQQVGEIVVSLKGQAIARTPLVASADVPKLSIFASIWRSVRSILSVRR
ncbi:MAG: D-alanyl-D-alanine carboxypeptidase family protein [Chloroflexota bacterium]